MIIGNGDIAQALKEVDTDVAVFFASGVSNSLETNEAAYARERILLGQQENWKHIVYFSSLSMFYKQSRYTEHKIQMESLIKHNFPRYTIVRIGNITWGDNPNTLINHMKNLVKNGEKVELRDEYRYIVDKEEFLHWMKLVPDWSCEMNITGRRLKVVDIFNEYCK